MIIKLGLYDDHNIVRAGFRQILSGHSDIEIVCEGATGREALAGIRGHELHVCIIDLSLPGDGQRLKATDKSDEFRTVGPGGFTVTLVE